MEAGQIYKLMPKVSAAVGAIAKNKFNQQQRFNYRGIDDVLDAFHKPLAEHGVTVLPEYRVLESTEAQSKSGGVLYRVRIAGRYTFVAGDGSSVTAETIGEAMDSGDKATNKAMSVAMKYAMFQVFAVPVSGVMDDADADTPPETVPPKLTADELDAAGRMEACTTLQALQVEWQKLPPESRSKLANTKDAAKKKIQEAVNAEKGAA